MNPREAKLRLSLLQSVRILCTVAVAYLGSGYLHPASAQSQDSLRVFPGQIITCPDKLLFIKTNTSFELVDGEKNHAHITTLGMVSHLNLFEDNSFNLASGVSGKLTQGGVTFTGSNVPKCVVGKAS